jgi:putative membrane protein
MNPNVPLHGGRGPGGWEDGSLFMLPFLGAFLLVLLLVALTGFYLWRQGKLTLPKLGGARSPEDDARRILAERFARGDISSDDFMERASILQWTPGSDSLPSRPGKKRR